MKGNVYIKGNLHLDCYANIIELKKDGLIFHAGKDVFFHDKKDINNIIFGEDDVLIEDIFEKFDVKDIIAFSDLKE